MITQSTFTPYEGLILLYSSSPTYITHPKLEVSPCVISQSRSDESSFMLDFERSPRRAPSWRFPAFLWLILCSEFWPSLRTAHTMHKGFGHTDGPQTAMRASSKAPLPSFVLNMVQALQVAQSFKFPPKFNSPETSLHKKIPQSTSPIQCFL